MSVKSLHQGQILSACRVIHALPRLCTCREAIVPNAGQESKEHAEQWVAALRERAHVNYFAHLSHANLCSFFFFFVFFFFFSTNDSRPAQSLLSRGIKKVHNAGHVRGGNFSARGPTNRSRENGLREITHLLCSRNTKQPCFRATIFPPRPAKPTSSRSTIAHDDSGLTATKGCG